MTRGNAASVSLKLGDVEAQPLLSMDDNASSNEVVVAIGLALSVGAQPQRTMTMNYDRGRV